MRHPIGSLAVVAAVAAAGCGASADPLPLPCTQGEGVVLRALQRAPRRVTLPDGTPLSRCVALATTDVDLQALGLVLTGVAERLADRGDALRLGYLVGAARQGAAHTAGVQLELVRRLEGAARRVGDGPALRRGLRAGEARG